MGLFDTIHFPEPIRIPGCEKLVLDAQCKQFGSLMRDYTIGSLLLESPVLIGVVKDELWCKSEEENGEGTTHPIYYAIWHRILAGAYLTFEEAEERLRTVDRLDLIAWLDQAQQTSRQWKNRYHRLHRDVRELHERQKEGDSKPESANKLRSLWHRLPEEVMQAPDPLATLLDMHRKREQEKDDDEFGWLF